MRERVCAHHRLVRLDRETGNLRYQLGGRHDLRRIDGEFQIEIILTGTHCHHDFFQRGVAGALA